MAAAAVVVGGGWGSGSVRSRSGVIATKAALSPPRSSERGETKCE